MSAIQETIDYVKEDGEFSDCKEQIELAESAQSEFDALNNYIKQLGVLMPCGHLARYAVNEEDGTQYCCMCLVEETQKRLQIAKSAIGQIAAGNGVYGQQAHEYKQIAKRTMEKI